MDQLARQALWAIREAGKELRPVSRIGVRRVNLAGELLSTASAAVEQLNAGLRRLRGEDPAVLTEPGRRASDALRRAARALDVLRLLLEEAP